MKSAKLRPISANHPCRRPPGRCRLNHSRLYEYGSDWKPVLLSVQNGGYNIYHKDHNFSKQGNGGYAEKVVGMTWDIKYINVESRFRESSI